MAVWCMRNAPGYNYSNSSFIVDLAMGRYHFPHTVFLVIIIIIIILACFSVKKSYFVILLHCQNYNT